MRVSRDQVAENRQRILEAAARLFRERGFEHVSVAEIMIAAGLTHGAFYGHFASKEDLIAQAFSAALAQGAAWDEKDLAGYAGGYLSAGHRDSPGVGCPFAALATEGARGPAPLRSTMTQALRRRIASFAQTAPGETAEERRRAAVASWSAMVGAVILARVADDPALSDEILKETRAWLTEAEAKKSIQGG